MPFDPKTARNAGKKSKRGPAKKEESTIKQKIAFLYNSMILVFVKCFLLS